MLSSATFDSPAPSPLVLCDRLISLAQEADRAGYLGTAGHLVHLALTMFEENDTASTPLGGIAMLRGRANPRARTGSMSRR